VFGAPCTPDRLANLAVSTGATVVFDAAAAFGAAHQTRSVGGFGLAEVFSLTPTKPLVAGEGGIVATNDRSLADIVRVGRDYGNPGDYDTRFPGLSARMSEFHAAVALLSLDMIDESLARRQEIAQRYQGALADVPGIRVQHVPHDDFSTYKDFVILVDDEEFGVTRDLLVTALRCDGIDSRNYFDPPVHRQRSYSHIEHQNLPVTDDVAKRVIALPMFTELTDDDIDRIVDVIASVHAHADVIRSRQDRHYHDAPLNARLGQSLGVTRR
jgi:dTDP-4-amino-4,6-dideoxygalactose transaminase